MSIEQFKTCAKRHFEEGLQDCWQGREDGFDAGQIEARCATGQRPNFGHDAEVRRNRLVTVKLWLRQIVSRSFEFPRDRRFHALYKFSTEKTVVERTMTHDATGNAGFNRGSQCLNVAAIDDGEVGEILADGPATGLIAPVKLIRGDSVAKFLYPSAIRVEFGDQNAEIFAAWIAHRSISLPDAQDRIGHMKYEVFDFDIRDNVAWITFNRPASLNAMNRQMMIELHDIANRCMTDKAVRAAVLTGSGERAFCAGGDVLGFHADQDGISRGVFEGTTLLHAAASRFAWMKAPLIAAVNGVAAGAGLSAVAWCDLAIAADTATFTSAYTKIGFTPDGSSTWFLSRMIGRRRAMELYMTNRTLTAQEALDWGLVNRVVPAADLMAEAGKLAAQLAQGPTRAFGGVKKLLMMATTDSLEGQMERESRTLSEMASSADAREGIAAFVEKRRARFTGE